MSAPTTIADDTRWLDATAQAQLVRSKDISASELVDAAIERAERLNPALNAIIHPLFEKARAASANRADGPFAGVPFLLKDIVAHSAGDPYHAGMRVLRDEQYRERSDSWLVSRYRSAGLIPIGRTNTPELAASITCEPMAYGATHNPWDLTRTPGGSSGGSAAAVASGIVAAAHANDMGGSIRIPASACGLVGLKASRGRSTIGPKLGQLWAHLTHEHVVTRSVRDSASILDAVSGAGLGDVFVAPPPVRPFLQEVGAPPGRLRVGVWNDGGDATVVAAVRVALDVLSGLGHHIDPSAFPRALADQPDGMGPHFGAVIAADVDRIGRQIGRPIRSDELEPPNALMCEMGRSVSAVTWIRELEVSHAWEREVVAWWHGPHAFDVLVTPTLPEAPWLLGLLDPATQDPLDVIRGIGERVRFTSAFNHTGQPAISLPLAVHDGLPIGVQLVAAPWREDILFRLAAQLEAAMPWRDRRPAL